MKILMISPYLPWPLHVGSSVRIFNLLKELSLRGNQIFLVGGTKEDDLITNSKLNQFCQKIFTYKLPERSFADFIFRSLFSPQIYPALKFQTENLREKLGLILSNQNFDLIWVNFSFMIEMLPLDLIKDTRIILDQHEYEGFVYQDYLQKGNIGEKIFALLNLIKFEKFTKKIFSQIDAVLCVSKEEAEITKLKMKNQVNIWEVPNGVSEEFFQPISHFRNKPNYILLCSNMNVQRNIDAAIWFVKNVFPKIKEKIPDAKFWIVGADPTPEVWKLNSISGVKVTGTVDNIKDYYQKGKVFVAPYHFGAGTKLKVLEAMASGIPVVSTTVGCRGIEVVDGKHFLIADNEIDFSNRVIELLTNFEKREKLALAARKLVEEKYQWKKIVDDLEPKLIDLVYARKK
jgi:glycosyltransferase involved in cell wall biosynthesis